MRVSLRSHFGLVALAAMGLAASGVMIGEVMNLQPCPLCIFQRLLYLLVAVFALCGVFLVGWWRLWGVLIGLAAAGGLGTAAFQSWLQFYPESSMACGFGEPTVIEQIVNWFGMRWPSLFLATGFCSSKDWVFLGLSMANWSAFAFLALIAAAAQLVSRRDSRR
ncbi:MAG: disulfide bond formation protein B [Candidatus Accumulibacter sp.]|uniref:disulfide bond formation protein B n=1 Tax=Accumulibacter sp. TaxID=2053492 RepID=UPI0019F2D011|nr:disulfide bond formation protein B [Accumulibacter sp.]MBE2259397.1 disulfide bond formation protein B [Paracoccaceae bacterium]MCP5247896.1 disulfide bond formation protein B [Accumulibacter sp.]